MYSKYFSYKTTIGNITIVENYNYIEKIFINSNITDNKFIKKETTLIKETFNQVDSYLKGDLKKFDLPLNPKGTSFQKQVWRSLTNIPYGESRSYKDIAKDINNPNAARAVGSANSNNPILLVIPCHRVINTNGSLGGFSSGLDIKRKLLKLENIKYKE